MDEWVKIIGNAILLLEPVSEDCSATPGRLGNTIDIGNAIEEVSKMSEAELDKLREKVQLYVCSKRSPRSEIQYYEFYDVSSTCITFNSKWIGDSAEGESRVLRTVDACRIHHARSNSDAPVYLLVSEDEVEFWKNVWRGKAFLTKPMVEHYFPTLLAPS
ncbi:hypothetical protein RBU55_30270 [Pseudomonas chlororaphis subsp. aurantiaca]|uniref:hypothetical protein n=1 Tax=Pseudomonas chlororaphis TaxID=587753 RepID=UPI0027DCE13F|nr:hypothetical protein [Pseudomonas chlororaphis]WMI99768.1 hypothetical protein RBU55_30270 [Pseudomonas chlororaphis subsp. aurantiaca]